jgi:hypothetical protein
MVCMSGRENAPCPNPVAIILGPQSGPCPFTARDGCCARIALCREHAPWLDEEEA